MNNILILIDDDGPGIHESEYQNVLNIFIELTKVEVKINWGSDWVCQLLTISFVHTGEIFL